MKRIMILMAMLVVLLLAVPASAAPAEDALHMETVTVNLIQEGNYSLSTVDAGTVSLMDDASELDARLHQAMLNMEEEIVVYDFNLTYDPAVGWWPELSAALERIRAMWSMPFTPPTT